MLASWFVKLPLRTVLIVPFVLPTVAAVGLVGYLSYKSGQQVVEDFANQLMEEVEKRISDRLDSYLQTPQQVVAANHLAWQQGTLDITDLEKVRQHLWQQMTLHPSLTGNFFFDDRGQLVAYGGIFSHEASVQMRKANEENLPMGRRFFMKMGNDDPGQRKSYLVDSKGKPNKMFYKLADDFRKLPFYISAKAAGKQMWTPIIVYRRVVPTLGMLAAAPVHNAAGEFQGVFTSDFMLADLSTFLNQLHFSSSGQAFIIERSGNLVATSTLETPYVLSPDGKPERLHSAISKDARTREIARQLEQRFGNFPKVQNTQQLSVISPGKKLFVRVVPYRDKYGLDWLIILTVPESDFMARINENTRLTILLCIATLIITSGIGVLTAWSITQPIIRLNAALRHLSKGEFTGNIPVIDAKEVGELTESFNQMTQVLSEYKHTLETQVRERTEALQRSEAQINAFFAAAPVGMGIVNKQLRFVKVNQVLAAIANLKMEEKIGKTIREVVPQKIVDKIEPLYQQVLATGKPILNLETSGEVPSMRGTQCYWIVSYFPIFTADSSPDGVGVVVVDMSDRKRAESELRESKRLIEQVTESTSAILYIFDLVQQRNVYVNSQIERLLGYSSEEIQAMGNNLFPMLIHPEDLPRVKQSQVDLQSRSDKEWMEIEYRMRDKQGNWHWLYSRDRILTRTASGQPAQTLGTATDITDRKLAEAALRESEQKFSTIFHASPDPVWMATLSEGRCLNVNDSFVKFVEYPDEEIIGKTCVELKLWDKIEDLHRFRQALKSEGKLENFEVVFRTQSRQARTVLISATVSQINNQDCVIGLLKDITDRKQLELALQTSEVRLRSVLNNAPAFISGVRLADNDRWEYEYFSPGIEAICGNSGEEIAADPLLLLSLVVPEDFETIVNPTLKRFFTPNFATTIEYRLRHKNGSIRWVANSLNTYWDQTTQSWYGTGIIIDITDRKLAEEALQQIEFRLQQLAAASPGVIYTVVEDPNGPARYDYLSPVFEEIHEIPVTEALKNAAITFNQIHPDDRPDYQQTVAKALKTWDLFRHEWRIITPSGKIKWIQANSRPQRRENGEIVWHGIVLDVTDRKLVEETLRITLTRLQNLATAAPGVLYSVVLHPNDSLEFEYINRGVEKIHEISVEQVLEDAKSIVIHQMHPDDRPGYFDALAHSRETLEIFKHEWRIVTPSGKIKWLQANSQPELRENGDVCWHGIVQDISDYKQFEVELSQAKEAAEAANRAKSTFLANMSHELRTPLNAIIGFAQLMSENKVFPPEHRENLNIINRSGKHLLTLINDMLDMATIEAYRITLNEAEFNLNQLLDDLQKLFYLKAKDKKLQFNFYQDIRIPEYVISDEIKLRQILINLISNAIKFTDVGGVIVRVRVKTEEGDQQDGDQKTFSPSLSLFFEIEDTGCGIPEHELQSIFEPFLQTRRGKQSQEGTGLGLSISRNFTQLMGGEITVKSQVGCGSTFNFEIKVGLVEPFSIKLNEQLEVGSLFDAISAESSSTTSEDRVLNPVEFAALPPSLVARLEQATIQASWQAIYHIIQEISPINPQLAEKIHDLVKLFDYAEILTAIDRSKTIKNG